ncbi:DUF1376 domain-containing protein [Bartonella machadoae]|uniref:DUF1376 domain-containing protein n=1 Tax=Bartonella machadoae TaxID=2893471 RepID=UPI001F4C6301|nr:DUF1376 domain-containing protein [Bartonella machadoae]UNE54929.1 YdaU family protein [Bartonella machadoae]UNE55339.1 YdaU family protein [Bartonella machadoae]
MSTKLAWTRLNTDQWIIDVSCMKPMEKAVYLTLSLFMRKTHEPLDEDTFLLSRYVGCSEKAFNKALTALLCTKKIIRLEDGRLWSLEVEEELNNSNENLSKASVKAAKAAKARWDEEKNNTQKMHEHKNHTSKNACAQSNDAYASKNDARAENFMLGDAHNNNINIYNKKNNTIVLSKKENDCDFENSEFVDEAYEPSEDHDCEKLADAIETVAEDQPAIHEQENIPKKAKPSRTDRGCRLPDDFEPDYDFAIAEGLPPERVKVEIAKFRDYWCSKTGANATKTNWQATWRNWVRRAIDDLTKGRNYGKPNIAQTEQQRGKSYRVAQYMSDIKNSDSAYKFLFEDDERTTIPLVTGTKTLDCRSGANYLTSQ